jgi:hypothetical protein
MIKDIREISRERLERTFMTNIVGMITIIQARPRASSLRECVVCLEAFSAAGRAAQPREQWAYE